MKKLIATMLVLTMVLSLVACGSNNEPSPAESTKTSDASEPAEATSDSDKEAAEIHVYKTGVLSMLNMSEDEMAQYIKVRKIAVKLLASEGYIEGPEEFYPNSEGVDTEVVFYDTLDSMVMALNAGDIQTMQVYYRTGLYLCAQNDNIQFRSDYKFDKEPSEYVDFLMNAFLGNSFSFLMMKENEPLRDEFNKAITDMKEDGSMDKLVDEQIVALINGGDIKPVEMPRIEGAETIKVAVTGALPPMDYVAEDGSPAGFNTAVLAEISKRIGKNIELTVVDSVGRSTALSSGVVDVAFWTRTNDMANTIAQKSKEELKAAKEELDSKMSEEEAETDKEIIELVNSSEQSVADMPENTICTLPYYSDLMVPMIKKQ